MAWTHDTSDKWPLDSRVRDLWRLDSGRPPTLGDGIGQFLAVMSSLGASGEVHPVLLAIQRVGCRPLPSRSGSGQRLVARETRLKDALAARHPRQRPLEIGDEPGGDVRLDRGEVAVGHRRLDARTRASEEWEDATDGIGR